MPIYLPETSASTAESMTPRQIVAELDKYVVGQHAAKRAVAIALRNRLRRQKLPRRPGRGGRAEEHPDDRADRRRQDRDRPAAGAADALAVHQGRGLEVHRGRLRRPRRRVDGARPRRTGDRDGARGAHRGGAREGAARPPRSGCSTCCCRRRHRRPAPTTPRSPRRASSRSARASGSASSSATGGSTSASSRSTCATRATPQFEIVSGSSVEEIGINLKDMLPGLFQGRTQAAEAEGPRGARPPRARGGAEADRHGERREGGDRARRAVGHHLRRRDRQDRRARGQRTGRT